MLSSSGVLDAVGMIGYRTDEVGLEGTGLQPAAQVWLEAGELLESQNDEPITSINGGLSNFLGVKQPPGHRNGYVVSSLPGSVHPRPLSLPTTPSTGCLFGSFSSHAKTTNR